MKRMALITLGLLLSSPANPGGGEDGAATKYGKGFRTEKDGWVFVHIEGGPGERGMQYGYLLAPEIEDSLRVIRHLTYLDTGKKWEFFVAAAADSFREGVPEEYLEEIKGIAEGAKKRGADISWKEVLALNAYEEIFDYWWPQEKSKLKYLSSPPSPSARNDHCSAFIATGKATEDGKIVIAHNDWSSYVIGESYNIILDVVPEQGHRFIMQTKPGHLDSNTDFFITAAGIVGTETTIAGFNAYRPGGTPAFVRFRRAMQYSDTIDDAIKHLKEGNNGGNASSWLFGDIKTGEIVRFELGLEFDSTDRTKDGYFIGFNAPADPRIRNLECSDTGYDDVRRHTGARRVRLTELMEKNYGKIDVEAAKRILADHYDVYLKKENNPCSRTVDGHYELDNRAFMSDPSRPKPYAPHGTLDGKVTDSTLAGKLALWARWGNSSGMPFDADEFLKKHIQYDDLKGYLKDRPSRPWTLLQAGGNER